MEPIGERNAYSVGYLRWGWNLNFLEMTDEKMMQWYNKMVTINKDIYNNNKMGDSVHDVECKNGMMISRDMEWMNLNMIVGM